MNIPGIMCGFGVMATIFGIVIGLRFIWYARFPSVQGVVEQSSVQKIRSSRPANPSTGGSTISYIITIKYKYCVNGTSYSSENVYSLGKMLYQYERQAQKALDSITENGNLRVFYNPSRPATSFLQNGTTMLSWFPFVIGVSMLFFGYYFLRLR